MGRSNETKDSAICVRMDQSAEAIKRQDREGQHGENPYIKVERGVPCLRESRETIKARIEVEPRVPGSHESRETINQTKQTFPTFSSENQNHNKSNYCKKRNSFEPAEVNEKKMKTEAPSKVGRIPIKITGTDINGNKLEINITSNPFLKEGDPISINQTQINLKPHKVTSSHIEPRKTTSNHIKPHKAT